MSNLKLRIAKREKNDEFYTLLPTIKDELKHYSKQFVGANVLCNCDGLESNFWLYFREHFVELGLKSLRAISFSKLGKGCLFEYFGEPEKIHITQLIGNGDFRSQECIEILKEADIVCTNPPFSLFRDYLSQIIDQHKKFLVLGSVSTAIANRQLFSYFKDNLAWAGYHFNKTVEFLMPDEYLLNKNGFIDEYGKKHGFVPAICWFTNLHVERKEKLVLSCKYNKCNYKVFDNIPSLINVDKVSEIPADYDGLMAVPITYLGKHDPSQFEIVEALNRYSLLDYFGVNEQVRKAHSHCCNIDGKAKYFRLVIRRK